MLFTLSRWLEKLWGVLPFERLKMLLVWPLGIRFIVSVIAVIFDDEGQETLVEALQREWLRKPGSLSR